ncbi:hypothetical protein G6M89_17435 [Natronolimnobius sp. AArcel1]|uniref:DUF7305 domain-containing protein n=1 Tax=Natronolimnobius sp. AArcel1 TaxID=1679093 RepID=UPI0013EBA2AB|nr:hypothetical protein [Natronolimnobius sp. AArcel1]NGM70765.1 hypothetical protein [Natronolimnobius sp. AArcel1]
MGGNPYFEGVVYAPSDNGETQTFDFSGTPHIDGSIVAGSAELSGNPEIRHHEELSWFDPQVDQFQYEPPQLTYLNMAYHEIELSGG